MNRRVFIIIAVGLVVFLVIGVAALLFVGRDKRRGFLRTEADVREHMLRKGECTNLIKITRESDRTWAISCRTSEDPPFTLNARIDEWGLSAW